jgi:GH15 family glucan-1,4-alpha-glucosidase
MLPEWLFDLTIQDLHISRDKLLSWLRDATFTLLAFINLGHYEEAWAWLQELPHVAKLQNEGTAKFRGASTGADIWRSNTLQGAYEGCGLEIGSTM